MTPPASRTDDASPGKSTTAAEQCLLLVRDMVLSGDLLPGEQVRQTALSQRVGFGSIPVREALAVLRGEGLLDYVPNAGYCVTRLEPSDLVQIYRLRNLLESELLSTLELDKDRRLRAAGELTKIVDQQADALHDSDFVLAAQLNRDVHISLLSLSDEALIVREAIKLWNRLELYRVPHLETVYTEGMQQDVINAHRGMVEAVRDGDTQRLVALAELHRMSGYRRLQKLVASRRDARSTFSRRGAAATDRSGG